MIAGIFHKGSGLGNQLHRYIATRVLALDKGYEWTIIAQDLFKGKDFIDLDMGKPSHIRYKIEEPSGKVIPTQFIQHFNTAFEFPAEPNWELWNEWDKNVYDPDINFIEDFTVIDGNFEDERYFEHRLPEISDWLKTEPIKIEDDLCVIGFRGGEYYTVPELGLPREYFARAIKEIQKINPDMKFEVHTDDMKSATLNLVNDECSVPIGTKFIQNTEENWQAVRYAKYAIIANSSFYVLPRLLNGGLTIAPRYWNRYNVKEWQYPQNYYKSFKYI